MAKLVRVWQEEMSPKSLKPKQMPLIVDDNLAMVMDVSGLKAIHDSPLVSGKPVEDFAKTLDLLTEEEKKASFEVSCKDVLSLLDQTVPCIGCRRSVERLFYDLSNLDGHPAIDPVIITSDGMLTLRQEILNSPQRLCTILRGHSTRLHDLVEQQPRNKKSRRCTLHSLEVQRMKPPPNAWREVWDSMAYDCLKEITYIDAETLEATLDTYLRKHKFCTECRTKVLLASSLLTTEGDPTKEKGYVSSLYADIRRCSGGHVHLPVKVDYIHSIIGRAQPEIMGRERHAKTLEIAQEEVLTCLGICVAERLNRIYRRLREEEIIVKVLAAVAIDSLSRNFQMAVEFKQGITQLEVLYKELKKEEEAKQQRREKMRLKRKKKKDRRLETEEKENEPEDKQNHDNCKCPQEEIKDTKKSTKTQENKEPLPIQPNLDSSALHLEHQKMLETNCKNPSSCNCLDCSKNAKKNNQIKNRSQVQTNSPNKKDKNCKKKNIETKSVDICNKNATKHEKTDQNCRKRDNEESVFCGNCKNEKINDKPITYNVKCNNEPTSEHLVDELIDTNKRYTMWIEVKKRLNNKLLNRNGRSSSEHSSQDCGYSSEHNVSSSSLPSTPEGSEVACSDNCCNREGDCHDSKGADGSNQLTSSLCIFKEHGGALTLSQMLQNSCLNEEDDGNSYIPVEEVLEFKSRMCQVAEKRQELRQTLKKRFAALCSHHKPFTIPR